MAITAADMDIRFGVSGVDKAEAAMRSLGGGFDSLARKGGAAGGFLKNALSFATGDLISKGMQSATRAISDGVSEVLDFGANMANVNSIMQLSDSGLAALQQQVIELASNPAITAGPAELAEGLYNVASSGFAGADGLTVLTAAAMGATAGVTTTDVAAQGLTAVLNAFHLEADQSTVIMDKMFQTVNDGVLSFADLANNLGTVLAPANALGVSLDELFAGYAQLTKSGLDASASETTLAAIMSAAMNPTQAMTDLMTQHGYASAQAAIEQESFAGWLKIVTDSAGGDQQALMDLMGTKEALTGVTILGTNGMADYNAEIERMTGSSGAAQKALEKQMQSAKFQIAQVRKELMVFATEMLIGFQPSIAGAAKHVASFIGEGLVPMATWLTAVISGNDELVSTSAAGGTYWSRQDMLLSKIPPGLRGTAMAMATVTQASINMAKGLVESFQAGKSVEELISVLPTSIQGAASAIFTFSDDIGDMIRQISQGDWSGLWEELKQTVSHGVELGEIALKATFHLVSNIAGDVWEWIKGAVLGTHTVVEGPGLGAHTEANGGLVDIGAVVLSAAFELAKDAFGAAENFAEWLAHEVEAGWNHVIFIDDPVQVNAKYNLNLTQDDFDTGQAGQQINDAAYQKGHDQGHSLAHDFWQGLFAGGDEGSKARGDFTLDIVSMLHLDDLAIYLTQPSWFSAYSNQLAGAAAGAAETLTLDMVAAFTEVMFHPSHIMTYLNLGHSWKFSDSPLAHIIDGLVGSIDIFAGDESASVKKASDLMGDAWDYLSDAVGDIDLPDMPDIPDWISTDSFTQAFNDFAVVIDLAADAIDKAFGHLKDSLTPNLPGLPDLPDWLTNWIPGGGNNGDGSSGTARTDTYDPNANGVAPYLGFGLGTGIAGRGAHAAGASQFPSMPFMDTSGIADAQTAIANAGIAAADATIKFSDGRAALDLFADSFAKAHEPVDLFASQTDAAMARLQTSITTHAMQSGQQLDTALATSMAQAAAIAQQGSLGVANAMAWLPGAMFGTGSNASSAFAQGLWSGVGEAEAAASALAAAADRAVQARLQIHSPSRVMAEHGRMAVQGFIQGLQSGSGSIASAFGAAFSPGGTGSSSNFRPATPIGNRVTIISVHSDEIQKIAEMARAGHEFADGFGNEFDMLTGANFQ